MILADNRGSERPTLRRRSDRLLSRLILRRRAHGFEERFLRDRAVSKVLGCLVNIDDLHAGEFKGDNV
jgi:hypothetical protein